MRLFCLSIILERFPPSDAFCLSIILERFPPSDAFCLFIILERFPPSDAFCFVFHFISNLHIRPPQTLHRLEIYTFVHLVITRLQTSYRSISLFWVFIATI